MSLIYQDRIYGKIKIEKPVILELVKSNCIQRLKGISQGGHCPIYFKVLSLAFFKPRVFRFEHSLGVLVLLKIFSASLEEQIAGLIHDVSHSVFSHTIDYVLKEGSEKTQSFQDSIYEKFVLQSEIPKILKKYGFDANFFLNKEVFSLLERELPDLCADRIDYSLRDAVAYKIIPKTEAENFIKNLEIINNQWVFKSFIFANKFAQFFKLMNDVYYSGIATALMYKTVGDMVSYSLRKGVLSKEDLFTSDEKVLKKIKKFRKKDENLNLLLKRMAGKVKFKVTKKDYNIHCFCKSRIVDPLFKIREKVKRLSEVNKNWAKIIKRESKPKEYFIKFEE